MKKFGSVHKMAHCIIQISKFNDDNIRGLVFESSCAKLLCSSPLMSIDNSVNNVPYFVKVLFKFLIG